MGYYVHTTAVSFRIKKENFDAAFKAACELNWRNDLKRGGRWSAERPDPLPEGPNEWVWFSWACWNYHETCKDLVDVLNEFGFEHIDFDNLGNIESLSFDSKTGNEDALLEAIAPFVEPGSYIEWQGEEQDIWRNSFYDGNMTTQSGRLVQQWED